MLATLRGCGQQPYQAVTKLSSLPYHFLLFGEELFLKNKRLQVLAFKIPCKQLIDFKSVSCHPLNWTFTLFSQSMFMRFCCKTQFINFSY